jgi:sortase A
MLAFMLEACSSGSTQVAAPEPPPATAIPAAPEAGPAGVDAVAAPAAPAPAAVEPTTPAAGPKPTTATDPATTEDDPVVAGPALTAASGATASRSTAPAGAVQAASASPSGAPASTGRIEIPAIGLNALTYEGVDLGTLAYGPGHWPGTPLPGHTGNTVFPGHRTTHSRPFWDIDKLVPGNEVTFTTPEGRFTYKVTERLIVSSTDTWVVNNTSDPTFTILACHPKGSARQRVVVKGALVSAPVQPPRPVAPPKAPPTTRARILGIL